ncbi:MAG: hypothetical protein D4S02_18245, partial [Rhodocyclaceae bacterium]
MKKWLGVVLLSMVALTAFGQPGIPERTPVLLARQLGLPGIPVPPDSPVTRARVALGRTLFMDRRLSHNNTLSCAMCHVPEQGFTSNELGTAIGIEGQSIRRNAPT